MIVIRYFRAKPCGHRHAHLSEILTCIERNGVPGFETIATPESPATEATSQEVRHG